MRKSESKSIFVFVRGTIDNIGSTDVKVSDYLTRFYDSVFVLGYFSDRTGIIQKANPIKIHVKPMKMPFLQGLTISFITPFKLLKIKPNTVLWNYMFFFPGGLLFRMLCPYTKMFIDIRSHPISHKSKFITAMYNAIFVWILKVAKRFVDGFTIISPSMIIYIAKRYGICLHKKVCVWPSGFDKELFRYVEKTKCKHYVDYLRKILGIKEHKVMIYYGSVTYSRLPLFKLLIETVNLLKKDYRDIKLLIVGKGDAVSKVMELIHSLNLEEDILLVPAVSYTLIPLMLMLSDIIIAPFPRDHNWLTQVPLKVIEALGMKKPVITTPLIELKRILPPEYLIDFDKLSPMSLKNKIETLLYSNAQRIASQSIGVENLAWDVIAEKLYVCIEGSKI